MSTAAFRSLGLLCLIFTALPANGQDFASAFSESCGEDGDGRRPVYEIFAGLDGAKQPQDFGVNANLGGRVSFNAGVPLADTGFGLQFGTAYVGSENAVQVFERVGGPTNRHQVYTTIGLFRRTPGWTAAVGYDLLIQDSYDRFRLGQWRGRFGLRISPNDEVGIRAAISSESDDGNFGLIPLRLRPISQGSVYWRHIWQTGARSTFWAGLSEGHAESNLALGDLPAVDERVLFGSDLHVPLNDRLALYGEANILTPADTGTVDAFLGFVFYIDGIAKTRDRQRFAPCLPLAGSPMFSVDLRR